MRSAADRQEVGWPDPASVVQRMLSTRNWAANSCQLSIGTSSGRRLTPVVFKILLQDQRPVVLLVTGGVHQRHGPLPRLLLQQVQGLFAVLEFRGVALLELRPLVRVVAEPFPQLGAGGHVLEPELQFRTL